MAAIQQVCSERQLPVEMVLEAVEVALISAYKRNFGGNYSITAQIDAKSGEPIVNVEKFVVHQVQDERSEISLDEARAIYPQVEVGHFISIKSTPADFGRIAAQTAKQVILQRIREAERDALYNAYAEREGEIVNGTVHKVDHRQVTLSLGNVEAILPREEQIPNERYAEGQRLKAFVSSVVRSSRGPQILVSRIHRNLLRRLLEVEVPEIYNGTVEVKSIAREAGYRSKIAVSALQDGVDPVGSCVGMRGTRIQNIVNELHGEKIDVVQWNPDIGYFIANALSPAKVMNVMLYDERGKTAVVVVPDKQLSLAIGKEGQNARLAAKLTGWRIDIKSAFEATSEVLVRIKKDEAIRERVAHRAEIFNMATAIIGEKDPLHFTDGELKLLSEAVEIVNSAEMIIRRERKGKIGESKSKRGAPSIEHMDILAKAEAILTGKTLPSSESLADLELIEQEIQAEPEPEFELEEEAPLSELDALALSVLSGAANALDEEILPVVQPEIKPELKPEIKPVVPEPVVSPVKATEKDELMAKAEALLVEPQVFEEETDELLLKRQQDKKKERLKKRRLVYDENLGEVVAERRRKDSRSETKWTDYTTDD